MTHDIRSILDRLATVESRITPGTVKSGLNAQQKSVPQLPALFKPRNISSVLKSKTDPDHPMKGEFVGDSVEPRVASLAETMQSVEEDMLGKVKRDFVDYLERLEDRNKIDKDLVHKAKQELDIEDPTEEIEEEPVDPQDSEVAHDAEDQVAVAVTAPEPPVVPEALAPVKSIAMEDGAVFEIHGNERDGFEIHHGGRSLPTRFPNIDHADMAVKIFQKRRQQQQSDLNQDYLEEK
jgi:hypothetical protein